MGGTLMGWREMLGAAPTHTETPGQNGQNPPYKNQAGDIVHIVHPFRCVETRDPPHPDKQRLDGDVSVVTDDEPELALAASEPCPRLACCAAHARGEQTPDRRWWCWKAAATVTLPDPDPSPALQCRRMADLWAEYMHQGLESS